MERLSIKTPDDFIALMGHSLGYWPKESLVCVTLDDRRIGATLRVDLPTENANMARFVETVAKYVASDREATGVVFGIFTHQPWLPDHPRPLEPTMELLTEELSKHDIYVRDGWLVGKQAFTSYFAPQASPNYPLERVRVSQLNAELVFRGSSIQTNNDLHIPAVALRDVSEQVAQHCARIEAMHPQVAIGRARSIWGHLLDTINMPDDEQSAELLADFKFSSVRDRLLADIPGLDAPLGELLLAETKRPPRWHRVDRAEQLLFHLCTRADQRDIAPVLTSLGIIQWWEGKGSRAHQCFQHALETDPHYRLAQLGDQMIGAGIVARWATDKNAAYQPPSARGPRIEGMGLG